MKTLVAVLCGAAFCLPAFPQNTGAAETSDQAFVNLAAQTDMTEAHVGQLAQEQSSSQAVKDYAQMLVTDHTKDYDALTAVANKAGLTVPKGLDAKQMKMIDPLAKMKGVAFDRHFEKAMVSGHEAAIAAYNKEMRDGQNADLKAYATSDIPVLEKHKSGAQDLEKSKAK